jgi:hypothetical protein
MAVQAIADLRPLQVAEAATGAHARCFATLMGSRNAARRQSGEPSARSARPATEGMR